MTEEVDGEKDGCHEGEERSFDVGSCNTVMEGSCWRWLIGSVLKGLAPPSLFKQLVICADTFLLDQIGCFQIPHILYRCRMGQYQEPQSCPRVLGICGKGGGWGFCAWSGD